MNFKNLTLIIFTLISTIANAQTGVIIKEFIQLPKDSIIKTQLIDDLNSFITLSQGNNENNTFVHSTQQIETFILLDEFKGIEKSRKFKNEHFYKPHLTNVVKLSANKYLLQISHIGVNDNTPYLRTGFNLIAHQHGQTFKFSSPLLMNTKNWKTKIIQNNTFYYQDTLNNKNALKYAELALIFDKKLKSNTKTTKIYCTNNRTELLKIIGVDYKLDYNGRALGVFSALSQNEQLIILGNNNANFNNFDPHDLWHDRLSLVVSRRKVNKPVDEGCAYLYGGSWGMSWDKIFKLFMEKVAPNKDTDWMYYKENKTNFGKSQAEHLMVDYVINALLIQKIEKEKGFSGVWELLNCGTFEKGNENYYNALNQIIGISKKKYNKEVWKLINKENKL